MHEIRLIFSQTNIGMNDVGDLQMRCLSCINLSLPSECGTLGISVGAGPGENVEKVAGLLMRVIS